MDAAGGRAGPDHDLPRAGRAATVPFVGFAEAYVLSALRHAGVPMQRIRPAVARLSAEFGLDHALASQRVYTDGAELIFDYASSSDDEALLTVVRTGQEHLAEVIREYLQRISYGGDGWAERLQLPAYTTFSALPPVSPPELLRRCAPLESPSTRWRTSTVSGSVRGWRMKSGYVTRAGAAGPC